jgi:hypothetical protein
MRERVTLKVIPLLERETRMGSIGVVIRPMATQIATSLDDFAGPRPPAVPILHCVPLARRRPLRGV